VPSIHQFSYPLFFSFLDLDEVPLLFGKELEHGTDIDDGQQWRRPALWPLNYLMDFRVEDHLKNGEGLVNGDIDGDSDGNDDGNSSYKNNTLLRSRIRRLLSERTDGACSPTPDQKIYLLTHLCYFGYCFNPVSFYYIMKKDSDIDINESCIEAIVAEVSNTPWNEMKCYCLHPSSKDVDIVKGDSGGEIRKNALIQDDSNAITPPRTKKESATNATENDKSYNQNNSSLNYIFNKTFHVSPFMELDYIYDWTFWNGTESRIRVSATMIKEEGVVSNAADKGKEDDRKVSSPLVNDDTSPKKVKHFNAFFDIHRQNFTPLHLGYQLFRLPVYCFIIQIWIHIEAFRLLLKGVEFIPHPKGSETAVSKIIAKVMAPVFSLMDWFSGANANEMVGKKDK